MPRFAFPFWRRRRTFRLTCWWLAIPFLILLAQGGGAAADTYEQWKARVFSETEQSDPGVSGQMALSPAGDGIPNLLKYAFGMNPHLDGSPALPKISFVTSPDTATGAPIPYPVITYRSDSSNPPADLYFVPEASLDLQSWTRGDAAFAALTVQNGANPEDPSIFTARTLFSLAARPNVFLRLRVLEGQIIPDDWQQTHFGVTGIDPNADPDGDGQSNFNEFLHGTDPNDYFDGLTPMLEIVSGNAQRGYASRFLPAPLIVRLSNAGAPLIDVPVVFRVANGPAQLAGSLNSPSLQLSIEVKTDQNGLATVYIRNGSGINEASAITARSGPALVSATESAVRNFTAKVSAGDYHSLTLDPDGSLWSWGDNSYGQLGDGTFDGRSEPRKLSAIRDAVDVSAGSEHTLTVTGDGSVYGWGSDSSGQLGLDTYDYRADPVRIDGISGVIAVAAGGYHSLFLRSDGTVWACGYNYEGELGNGEATDSVTPVQVLTEGGSPLTGIVAISAGYYHSLALREDGTVWTWGANWDAMLGDGTFTDRHLAVQTPGVHDVAIVRAGAYHSVVLGKFGTDQISHRKKLGRVVEEPIPVEVWTWGANFSDQLGTGTYQDSPFPLRVSTTGDVVDLAAGFSHTLAVLSDGSVSGWGSNSDGEITGHRGGTIDSPGTVSGLSSIISVGAGSSHSLALASTGLIYAWGANSDGQLGISQANEYSPPVATTKDTNHSGLPDAWQAAHFGHLGVNPNDDADGDGLSNAWEYRLGTDPNKSDTDGDGVDDSRDGWPLDKVVSVPPVPTFRYGVIDITDTRIWAANNSPDGVIDFPVDRIEHARFPDIVGFDNGSSARPVGFNDDGKILADIYTLRGSGTFHAGIFPDMPIFVLGDTDESYSAGSRALDINNRGDVLLNPHLDSPDHVGENLVLWNGGILEQFSRRTDGALNNDGDIVSGDVLYQDRGATSLPLIGRYMTDRLEDGKVLIVGDPKEQVEGPVIYYDGQVTSPPKQADSSEIFAINNSLQMIGNSAFEHQGLGSSWSTLWENGRAYRIDTELLGAQPYDYTLYFYRPWKINERGMFVCFGYRNLVLANERSYLLMPVDLIVDGNRDGQMSLTDRFVHDDDITSADKPYRFWINDDDDTEEGAPDGDTVPPLRPDYSLHRISSKRNLEDLSRLWIYLSGLSQRIKSGEIQVGLRWKTITSGSPAINIYPSADGAGSDSYLKDDRAASAQVGDPIFDEAVRSKSDTQTIDSSGIFAFRTDYWQDLSSQNSTKAFLFEGAGEGKGELEVVFLNRADQLIGTGGSVWLELKNIKNMYERWTVDPTDYVPSEGAEPDSSPSLCQRGLPSSNSGPFTYASGDPESLAYIVFVHGWNLGPDDKDQFAETAFKRLFWQGYKGRFAAFQWPTTWGFDGILDTTRRPRGFDESEFISWKSAPALSELLAQLDAQCPGRVFLMAHSHGNIVAGEALRLLGRSGRAINSYAACQAAVAAESYDPTASILYPLRFPTGSDSNTPDIYPKWLASNSAGVQVKINFYNENDWALNVLVWELDEALKPDFSVLGTSYGWGAPGNINIFAGEDRFWALDSGVRQLDLGNVYDVRNRYEIISFAAEPRSRALGRFPSSVTGFGNTGSDVRNLQTIWGVDPLQDDFKDRRWHSGEFTFTNIEVAAFWERLLIDYKLKSAQ